MLKLSTLEEIRKSTENLNRLIECIDSVSAIMGDISGMMETNMPTLADDYRVMNMPTALRAIRSAWAIDASITKTCIKGLDVEFKEHGGLLSVAGTASEFASEKFANYEAVRLATPAVILEAQQILNEAKP